MIALQHQVAKSRSESVSAVISLDRAESSTESSTRRELIWSTNYDGSILRVAVALVLEEGLAPENDGRRPES
jgi:hypothetical protein